MYEASIETVFAAGHALRLPDGSLEPMHGHNWALRVTVGSGTLDAMDTVIDFHELERIVADIITPWQNRVLNEVAPFAPAPGSSPHADAERGLPSKASGTSTPAPSPTGGLRINPSAERVAEHVGQRVADALPTRVRLLSVHLGEAPGCTAVYRPR